MQKKKLLEFPHGFPFFVRHHPDTGISVAYKKGARVRVGAELEIPGYMCQDHFHEFDTECHSWEVLAEIVKKSNDVRL